MLLTFVALVLWFVSGFTLSAQDTILVGVAEVEEPRVEPRKGGYALVVPSTGEVLCLGDTIAILNTNRWSRYYVRQQGLWGVMAPDGTWEVPCISTERPDWEKMGEFSDIYWWVSKGSRKGLYGNVLRGERYVWEEIVPIEMDRIKPWDVGRQFYYWLRTQRYGIDGEMVHLLSGLYDSRGKEIFPTIYRQIELLGRDELLIDDGKQILSYQVDDVVEGKISREYAQQYRQLLYRSGSGLWALTMDGVLKMESYRLGKPFRYELTGVDSCQLQYDGIFTLFAGGKQGLMRLSSGELTTLVPPIYDEVRPRTYTDQVCVRKGQAWGLVDTQHRIIIPIEYDEPPQIDGSNRDLYVLMRQGEVLYYSLPDNQLVLTPP